MAESSFAAVGSLFSDSLLGARRRISPLFQAFATTPFGKRYVLEVGDF